MDVLQALYDSEINFSIHTFWDAGFTVALGDEMNGFVWIEDEFRTLQEGIDALAAAACQHFPNSTFAKARSATMTEPGGSAGTVALVNQSSEAHP